MEPVEVACAFAREVIAPNAARWEEERRYPREAFPEAAARGLCGLVVPVEMGGAGLGAAAMARVMEELAGADMAFSFGLVVHNNLAGAIARHGDPRHVETYLDDLIAGRRVGAFLLTEPRGGSDAGAISHPGAARKWWLGYRRGEGLGQQWGRGRCPERLCPDRPGPRLARHRLFSRASGSAGRGARALLPPHGRLCTWHGSLSVRRLPGRRGSTPPRPRRRLQGGHGRHRFGACQRRRHVLRYDARGPRPGAGRDGRAPRLRPGHRRLPGHPMDAGRRRHRPRGEPSARLRGGPAARCRRGWGPGRAPAKKFATRAALTRLADCMQAMGADGYRADCPLSRHLACAKMAQYLDGTTEIQNVVISRALRRRATARKEKETTP